MSEPSLPAVLFRVGLGTLALTASWADGGALSKFFIGPGGKAYLDLAKKVPAIGKFFAAGVCSSGEWLGAAFARALAASAQQSEKGKVLDAFKTTHWWINQFSGSEKTNVETFCKTLLSTKDADVAGCFGAAWYNEQLAEILNDPTATVVAIHVEILRATHLKTCREEFQTWFIEWVRDDLPGRFSEEVHKDPSTAALWHSLQLQSIAAQVGGFESDFREVKHDIRKLAQLTADQFTTAKQQSLSPETVSQFNSFAELVPGLIEGLTKLTDGDRSAFVCLEVWQPIVSQINDHTTRVVNDAEKNIIDAFNAAIPPRMTDRERELEREDAVRQHEQQTIDEAVEECKRTECALREIEEKIVAEQATRDEVDARIKLLNAQREEADDNWRVAREIERRARKAATTRKSRKQNEH